MQPSQFLKAEWRKLVMANYLVDPSSLASLVPPKTELDFFKDDCYVSLVGFMFREVTVRGMRIPFHINFPEVNLRFYVRLKSGEEWKRGVVFVKEIVPKPAISFVANTFFGERYITLPMKYGWQLSDENFTVDYKWKFRGKWNQIEAVTEKEHVSIIANSEEEFITQHFWGYTAMKNGQTAEYHVTHPEWDVYPLKSHSIDCDFAGLYGNQFAFLANAKPTSVFLAEGSPIEVFNKRIIN